MNFVKATYKEDIACITMNHPAKLNALSEALIDDILTAIEKAKKRESRVVLLRAMSGAKVWSAGHDVSELPAGRRDPLGWSDPLRHVVREIEEHPAPVIAVVEGGVWGGACEVALACDMVIATSESTYAVTPTKLGVPYNSSGLATFMKTVPMPVLKELLFTAQPIPASRALEMGIINHVVDAANLDDFVRNICEQIKCNAPLSISVIKEQLRILSSAQSITPGMAERIQGLRRVVYDSQDYKEGLQAFKEKRKPNFNGE